LIFLIVGFVQHAHLGLLAKHGNGVLPQLAVAVTTCFLTDVKASHPVLE